MSTRRTATSRWLPLAVMLAAVVWVGCAGDPPIQSTDGPPAASSEPSTPPLPVVDPAVEEERARAERSSAVLASMADLDDAGPYTLERTLDSGGFTQAWFQRADTFQRFFLLDIVADETVRHEFETLFVHGLIAEDRTLSRTFGYDRFEVTDRGNARIDDKIVPWIGYRWHNKNGSGEGSAAWLRCDGRANLLFAYSDIDSALGAHDHLELLSFANRFHFCR